MPDLDLIKQVEQERGTSQEFGGGPDRCCFAANNSKNSKRDPGRGMASLGVGSLARQV
jgi:hypothetical protein